MTKISTLQSENAILQERISNLEALLADKCEQASQPQPGSGVHFQRLFETMRLGVIYQDADGIIILANPAARRILDLSLENIQNGQPADYRWRCIRADGSDIPWQMQPANLALRTGKPAVDVIMGVYLPQDKKYRWVLVTALPEIQAESTQVAGVYTTFLDITIYKQVEAALLEREQKLNKLLEILPVGISVLDAGQNLVYENPTLEKILGINQAGLLHGVYKNRTYLAADGSLMPPDGFASARAAQSGEAVYNVETGMIKADGDIVWTSVSAVPVNFSDWKTVVTSTDLTERKRAEEQRALLVERLDLATRSAHMGIWDWDIQKNKLVWDNQMYALYGIPPDKFPGAYETWLKGVHPDDRAPSNEISQHTLRGERDYDTEFRVLWPDGSTHWLKANGEVFRDKNGVPLRMVGVNYDITERKKAEEELRRSNTELEQFAYVASHDLQEPLRTMAGMVQLLAQRYRGKLDERADEYIDFAVDGSLRMQNLINDLLDYSRVGRSARAFEPASVEEALLNALTNLQTSIGESKAHITHEPLPVVKADSGQLTRVFQNLISNAIKFQSDRPLQIHIGAQKLENFWQFTISDNGIGIEPQYFERIFLIFQRLHTHSEYPGTGIGLALCKKIIERHGGRIDVKSQPGQGTTFYFTIPEMKA